MGTFTMSNINDCDGNINQFEYLEQHQCHKNKSINNFKFHKFLKGTVRKNVENCGTVLGFNLYQNTQNFEDLRRTLIGANFCKHRYCIMCSWRKAKKLQLQTLATIRKYEEEYHKRYCYLFLTLTVPNPKISDLNSTIKRMSKAFKKLSERQEFNRAVKGFIRAIEFIGDHTKPGMAHPHYHCLLVVERYYFTSRDYITQERWKALWSECYGEDVQQVRIQKIKPKKTKDGTVLPALISGVLEVIKYSVSLESMNRLSDADLRELLKQTRGVRQFNRGGFLKDLVEDIGEIDSTVWNLIGEEWYRWSKNKYVLMNMENDLDLQS